MAFPAKLAHERAEKYLKQLALWEKRDTPSRTLVWWHEAPTHDCSRA